MELANLTLVTATVSVAIFCTLSLVIRSFKTPAYLPLACLFLTLCSASGGPLVKAFAPNYLDGFYQFTFPAYLSMGPLLWFYVKGLTAEKLWHFSRRDLLHFAPFLLGLVLVILNLTVLDYSSVKGTGRTPWPDAGLAFKIYVASISVLWRIAIFLWYILPFYYAFRVLRRLTRYRIKLKSYFASNENRNLGWINGYLVIFAAVWVIVLITVIRGNVSGSHFINPIIGTLTFLVLVVSLGLLGLSQKPGFEGRYLDDNAKNSLQDNAPSEDTEKYQRSALSPEQSERIAAKINQAMERDELYLDPSLSLHKLAKHILVSPNYISQTLNGTIGECFFDYVNKWRIEAAKPDVMAGEKTVLSIAYDVGFNARSSFYKAFKRETGQTPSEYRITHSAQT